jgi:hypothetical protein
MKNANYAKLKNFCDARSQEATLFFFFSLVLRFPCNYVLLYFMEIFYCLSSFLPVRRRWNGEADANRELELIALVLVW